MMNSVNRKCVISLLICVLLLSLVGSYNVTPIKASNNKMVALTFDDGPNSLYTSQLLDILDEHNAKATFFVVGQNIASCEAVVERAFLQGCEILGHSWSHSDYTDLSSDAIEQDLQLTNNAIFDAIGVYPSMFRPPYGSIDDNVISVAKDMGFAIILWAVDSNDWESLNADEVREEIMANVRNGCIILCHDMYDTTVEAMEQVIPALISDGYELVTVSELLGETEAGKLYANSVLDWKGLTHTVMPGDDLSQISVKYGTTKEALMILNELKTDIVNDGLILRIPCTGGGSLEHDWGGGVYTYPTCEMDGYWTYTCVKCPVSYEEEHKDTLLGHDWVSDSVVGSTCVEQGYTVYVCTNCDVTENRDFIDELGHEWDEGVVTVLPTEDLDGVFTFTCLRCDEVRTEIIPAFGHVHDYVTVVTLPSCVEQGYTTYTCSDCGDSYVDDFVDALDHDFSVTVEHVDATCTEAGHTLFECSRCDETYLEFFAPGHVEGEGVDTDPATCDAEGELSFFCTLCGEFLRTETIPALNHDLKLEEVVAPTCVDDGYTIHFCSLCGDVFHSKFVNALGHDLIFEFVLPVDGVDGYVRLFCSICDYEKITVLPSSNDHDHVWNTERVDATCEVDGYVRLLCSICDEEVITVLPALAHVWNKAIIPATRNSLGSLTLTCLLCNETKTESLACYIVQSGDTLELISQTYDITIDMLLTLNEGLTIADVLFPGRELQILAPEGYVPPPADSETPNSSNSSGGSGGSGSSGSSRSSAVSSPVNSPPSTPIQKEPISDELSPADITLDSPEPDDPTSPFWSSWRIIFVMCVVAVISAVLTIIGVADNLLPKRLTRKP